MADVTNTFTEPEPSALLLLLGQESDAFSERGVDCPGDLPAPSDPGLVERAWAARRLSVTGRSSSVTTTSAMK